MVTAVKRNKGARDQRLKEWDMLLQILESLLKAPNQVRGQALHSWGGNGRQSVQRSALRWQHGWEEPGEQAERSRGEVEGREVKVKTWI